MMNKEHNFVARVLEERELQRRLWPEPHDSSHSWMEWSAILSKYLGDYSAEACDFSYPVTPEDFDLDIDQESLNKMETALVKLAAVALACYEKL